MIGKTFGDSSIVVLYNTTARFGYEKAIKRMFGMSAEDLSKKWKQALEDQYKAIMPDTVDHPRGEKILFAENAGNINVSPSLSPDGKYVVFHFRKGYLHPRSLPGRCPHGQDPQKTDFTDKP